MFFCAVAEDDNFPSDSVGVSTDEDEIIARGHPFISLEKDPDAIKAANMKKRKSEEMSDFDLSHR